MTDFLDNMAALSAERASQVTVSNAALAAAPPVVPLALRQFDVIAEIKAHSPAEGALAPAALDHSEQARKYAQGGAAAISVLTEPSRFAGELQHLEEVVAAVPDTPVMRKDFLVEPVQILEARAAGASGVLLIATMLEDAQLDEMLDCAFEHALFVLLEAFTEADLARASTLLEIPAFHNRAEQGQLLIGVNTRNLRTLEVDANRLQQFAPLLPAAKCVAESGLRTADDVARAAQAGYHLALVGSALMRSDDPAGLVAAMRQLGSARIAA